jgi:peptidylprolyl isomerase
MKFIQALVAATLFVSNTLPPAAQTPTAKRKAVVVTQRATKPTKARRKTGTSSLVKTTPSGLGYIITRRGEGREPRSGEKVMVQYTGVLGNGVKFDSSLDRGQPFVFELGAGHVIKGWDEGIAKLRVGDQATLIIPPQLGYGAKGIGVIPPYATLIFIVELVGIKEPPLSN